MRTRKGYKACPTCGGNGQVMDAVEQGQQMRALRKAAQKGLRQVATTMGLSAPYISDLELGRRGWNTELIQRYKRALRA